MTSEQRHAYDDPYRVLAASLVSTNPSISLKRIMTDDRYVRRLVATEVREQDFGGVFVDCIIEMLLSNGKRTEYMHKLDDFANYLMDNLDLERLRRTITEFLEDYSFSLDV